MKDSLRKNNIKPNDMGKRIARKNQSNKTPTYQNKVFYNRF